MSAGPPKNPEYETESKVDMGQLREAAQKVFAYGPPASRRDSIESQAAKHRKRAQKGSKPPARS